MPPFSKDKKSAAPAVGTALFFVIRLFKIVMEFNRTVRFKSQPLIEDFGVGIVAGSGIIGLKVGKFLCRMDVDGKAPAVDQRFFRIGVAVEGQDVGNLGLTDFDSQIIAEDEDVEVVGIGIGFAFGRNGIADVILAVSRFGLGDVQALMP